MTVPRLRSAASSLFAALLALAAHGAGATEPGATGGLRVEVRDALLSLDARDASLDQVLRTIGAEAGFEVVIKGDLSTPVTRSFDALPMDQGIRRLLGGNSFILFFDGTGAARRLRRLRAYGATGHGGVAVADIAVATGKEPTLAEPEAWILNKLKEPERGARIVAVRRLKDLEPEIAVGIAAHILAQDDDPVVRGQAAAVLSKIGGDRAISVLDATLVDASDSVRRHAIRALGALGSDSAADALGRVLLEHPDRAERLMAIEALEGNASEAARSYLESARADRDAAVRQAIAVALDRRGRRAPVDTTKKATWKDSPNYRAGKLVK